MADDGTLQQLAQAVTNALQPLQSRLAAGDARTLLAEMGLSLPPSLDGLTTFSTATSAAITAVEGLAAPAAALATAVEGDDIGAIVSATTTLLSAVSQAISALDNVATALSAVATSLAGVNPGDVTSFAATFGEKLLEHVVIDYLAGYRPVLLRVLALLGIVNIDLVPPDGSDPAKPAFQRHDLELAAVGQLVSDPATLPARPVRLEHAHAERGRAAQPDQGPAQRLRRRGQLRPGHQHAGGLPVRVRAHVRGVAAGAVGDPGRRDQRRADPPAAVAAAGGLEPAAGRRGRAGRRGGAAHPAARPA